MELKINDVLGIIQTIKNTYPYSFKNLNIDDEKELENELNNTANLWFALLSEYPRELVIKAFHEALKVEKVNIVPASIIEQIEKIQSAFKKSDNEMWEEMKIVINKAKEYAYRLKFTAYDTNGKTQGQNAAEALNNLYQQLEPCLKRYVGGVDGLMSLTRLTEEQMEFEKSRFLKDIKKRQKEIQIQNESPHLIELTKNIGLLQ